MSSAWVTAANTKADDAAWGKSNAGRIYTQLSNFYDWLRANFWKIIYIIVAIVVSLGTFVMINNSGRPWTGMTVLGLFILLSITFYIRWFGKNSRIAPYAKQWPPIINTCPDYLVYFNYNGKDTCIDMLGVNQTGGMLRPWTADDNPANPPADTSKYFPAVYKPGMSADAIKALKATASAYQGLTWEGIIGPDGGENGCTIQDAAGTKVVCSTVAAPAAAVNTDPPKWVGSK